MVGWWLVASVVANLSITAIEYLNRTQGFATPLHAFRLTGPLIVLAQIGLFYAWRDAPSFMLAWSVFFMGSVTLRLVSNHFWVNEPLSATAASGIAMIVAGALLVKAGT